MKKKIGKEILFSVLFALTVSITAFANTTYSDFWKQDASGNWFVQKPDGTKVVNAWLCDDAVAANGKDVWYLLDANGQMISAGLVQDGTGNYYSIETEHNGYYGMLRYKSGNYGGIDLQLEGSHNGSFAAIKNADGIAALNAKYGLKSIANINNANCVYTSSFGGKAQAAGGSSGAAAASNGMDPRLKNMDVFFEIKGQPTDSALFDKRYAEGYYRLWPYGMCVIPQETYDLLAEFLTSFDWINATDEEKVEQAYNRVACNHNGNTYTLKKGGSLAIIAKKTGNCQNYAQDLAYLCRLMDMDAKPLYNGYNHETTRIVVDGVPYSFDASAGFGFYSGSNSVWEPVD